MVFIGLKKFFSYKLFLQTQCFSILIFSKAFYLPLFDFKVHWTQTLVGAPVAG